MTLEAALLLAVAICLLTVKPGPGMLAILSRALADGFAPAFYLALGIITIQTVFFSLSVTGLTLMEAHLESLTSFMKVIAAVYMFYLAYRGFSNLKKGVVKKLGGERRKHHIEFLENYSAGLMITLSNPFVILFYAAVVPAIINVEGFTFFDYIIALSIILGLNLTLLCCEALLAASIRENLENKKLIYNINLITSISFVLIGLFLTYTLLPVFSASLGFAES
jgi:threonine/homoserine/homoserine lactone efflux protein